MERAWRLRLLTLFLFFICMLSKQSNIQRAHKPPNVILILADDLGFGDLGWKPFYSLEMSAIKTLHLQRMAKEGKVFSNYRASSASSSASRASILTGLVPWRLGYTDDTADSVTLPLLPTIPMALRDIGYYTAHVGNWGLGRHPSISLLIIQVFL